MDILPACMYVHHTGACWIPWKGLRMCVLITEPRSSEIVAAALNLETISPAPYYSIFIYCVHMWWVVGV